MMKEYINGSTKCATYTVQKKVVYMIHWTSNESLLCIYFKVNCTFERLSKSWIWIVWLILNDMQNITSEIDLNSQND